jgi:hypothetical protein
MINHIVIKLNRSTKTGRALPYLVLFYKDGDRLEYPSDRWGFTSIEDCHRSIDSDGSTSKLYNCPVVDITY